MFTDAEFLKHTKSINYIMAICTSIRTESIFPSLPAIVGDLIILEAFEIY